MAPNSEPKNRPKLGGSESDPELGPNRGAAKVVPTVRGKMFWGPKGGHLEHGFPTPPLVVLVVLVLLALLVLLLLLVLVLMHVVSVLMPMCIVCVCVCVLCVACVLCVCVCCIMLCCVAVVCCLALSCHVLCVWWCAYEGGGGVGGEGCYQSARPPQ